MEFTELTASYTFAFLIGFIVSLDVAGLLISQHKDFNSKGVFHLSINTAILHALTHSILFLAYFYLVFLSIEMPYELMVWLRKNFAGIFPEIEFSEVLKTISLLSSIIIIIFVWITYSQKIIENHQEKPKEIIKGAVDFRLDIRMIFHIVNFIRIVIFKKSSTKFILNFALALTVAVDMLAITSFIRVFFTIAPDAASLSEKSDDTLAHFNFGFGEDLDPLIFSSIIFISVFIFSNAAIIISRSITDMRNSDRVRNRFLGVMRLLEPFFVFWLLAVSLDHLFGNSINSIQDFILKVVYGFFISISLTLCLVFFHGFKNILEKVSDGSNFAIHDSQGDEIAEKALDIELFKKAVKVTGVFFGILLLIILVFYISHRPPIKAGEGLNLFLQDLSAICSIFCLLLLFLPAKWLSEKEFRFAETMRKGCGNRNIFWNPENQAIFFSSLAYIILVGYIHWSFSSSSSNDRNFITPLWYLGLIAFSVWGIVLSRRVRIKYYSDTGAHAAERRNFFQTTLGDVLTAFALVVFGLQYYWLLIL